MKRYVIEFIGTFFLMLAIILLVKSDINPVIVPIGIGAVLMGMIYAGGHISKAHYNPAVTLAFYLRKGMKSSDVLGYLIAQIVAVVVAEVISLSLLENSSQVIEQITVVPKSGMIAEFLGTFALVFVILNVATAKNNFGNSHYGVAIGLTVIGCIYLFGDTSGAALNPAVAIGLVLTGLLHISDIWLYFVSEILAAMVATYTFLYTNGKE